MIYTKHFIPLESDPDVFTQLMHDLGVTSSLQFIDIWSVDDPEQLALIPCPVLAFILVLPADYNQGRDEILDEARRAAGKEVVLGEQVLWFKQTIHNACGLFALLHAVCNVKLDACIKSDSVLDSIVKSYVQSSPAERAKLLEDSKELEMAHKSAAHQGSSAVPDAKGEVDHHYICFVRGADSGLYELDGSLEGPVLREASLAASEDAFFKAGLDAVRRYLKTGSQDNPTFSLLALVSNDGE